MLVEIEGMEGICYIGLVFIIEDEKRWYDY